MALANTTPLYDLRRAKSLTLPTVARAVGCNKGHLSRIERGIVRPRLELQNKLVRFFDGAITRDEIVNPEEYVAPPTSKKPVRSARLQEVL